MEITEKARHGLHLSDDLQKEIVMYFETFHPKFLTRNFRRVYLGHLKHILQSGTPNYLNELIDFVYQMDYLFDLLELADKETAD